MYLWDEGHGLEDPLLWESGLASAWWDTAKAWSSNELVQVPILKADQYHLEEVTQLLASQRDEFCNLLLPKI